MLILNYEINVLCIGRYVVRTTEITFANRFDRWKDDSILFHFRKILRHEQEARQGRVGPLQEVLDPNGQSGRILKSGGGKFWVDLENVGHYEDSISGQSYKASTLVNYDSRVVSVSNLLVITTLE